MILDPAIAVADDLFVFRCMATIMFDEPKLLDVGEIDTFSRLYGITARSYSEAVSVLERFGGRAVDDGGEPVGSQEGWLEEIEVTVMDPEDISREVVAQGLLSRPGVHFVSAPMYFDEDGDQLIAG